MNGGSKQFCRAYKLMYTWYGTRIASIPPYGFTAAVTASAAPASQTGSMPPGYMTVHAFKTLLIGAGAKREDRLW